MQKIRLGTGLGNHQARPPTLTNSSRRLYMVRITSHHHHTGLLYFAALRLDSKKNKIQYKIKGYILEVAQCDKI